MKRRIKHLLIAVVAVPLCYHVIIGAGPEAAGSAASARQPALPPVAVNPDRNAYFGDLHLHTSDSFDAYVIFGTRVPPKDAYRFARGDRIEYLGEPVRKREPLDFLAVTDHAENMSAVDQLADPKSEFSLSEIGKLARAGGYHNLIRIFNILGGTLNFVPGNGEGVAPAWQRVITTANAHYIPGKFTTFIAYEWTSTPDGKNLHRNVIFRGDSAPLPFTAADSKRPEDLWAYLSANRTRGHEALAIPHNANASNGIMYDWSTLDGRPIDEGYAQLRLANEPLSEITQTKGTSESHPALSPTDEFANFEIFDKQLVAKGPSKRPGSYWRDSLGRGLVLGAKLGTNPYKDGTVGAADLHGGMSVSAEQDYGGMGGANLGGGRLNRRQVQLLLEQIPDPAGTPQPETILSSAGLTGVWAESNTRPAIYAALRRKETFATSGTRIKLRFFGGWDFAPRLLAKRDWVRSAYRSGTPMGGDLRQSASDQTPSFIVDAVKDPNSGNLDRVQVIKVWLENGQPKERIFDIAWSGTRRPDPITGKVPAVGDTVDRKTGRYANSIGAARLSTVWRDPSFRPDQASVYYLRVLEIPTPRWSTLHAVRYGLPLPKNVPAAIQERAWSSPIWYTPTPRN